MSDSAWDLCVLGAGPAGFAAAMRAHDLGKRVCVVERDLVGGAGVHAGALSSKTMWHLSNDFATAMATDRGYRSVGGMEVSYPLVIESVRAASKERRELLEHQLSRLAGESHRSVSLVRGTARFLSSGAVEVKSAAGELTKIDATNFLIATGSTPRVPDGIEVDGEHIVTSDQIESFNDFPGSLVIVGAGVIGCEYATIFANFGRTKVNIIDRQPRILPFEDEDVAEEVARSFEGMGINMHRSSRLESMSVKDGMVEYVVSSADGSSSTIRVEKALDLQLVVRRIRATLALRTQASNSTAPAAWLCATPGQRRRISGRREMSPPISHWLTWPSSRAATPWKRCSACRLCRFNTKRSQLSCSSNPRSRVSV